MKLALKLVKNKKNKQVFISLPKRKFSEDVRQNLNSYKKVFLDVEGFE